MSDDIKKYIKISGKFSQTMQNKKTTNLKFLQKLILTFNDNILTKRNL